MRIAFATDERTEVTERVRASLLAAGHRVDVVADGAAWPEVGRAAAQAVVDGAADRGVVFCTTGTGVAMAANKVGGARAALCTDAWTAAGARRWNDANVLALGLRLTTEAVAGEIVAAFLETPFDPDEAEAVARVDRVT
jgi:ribose 5-phosphate isomerase B